MTLNVSLTLDDVLEIAMQIERNGSDFYRKATELANSPDVGSLLLDLAEDEDRHERIFEGIRRKLVKRGKSLADYDKEGVVSDFLHVLGGNAVFNSGLKLADELKGISSATDILAMAIEKEKDSMVFYLGLRDLLVADEDGKSVGQIIGEEQRHLVDLIEAYEVALLVAEHKGA